MSKLAQKQSQMVKANHTSFAPERLDRLRAALREQHIVRVEELCRRLGASPATVRRDLAHLEKLGEVQRVHGGAIGVASQMEEPLFDAKTTIARKEKQRIARAALAFVKPGTTIYLDGGSTVLELARLLREHTNLTIVTNSLRAAVELAGRGPRLILIGGELRRLSQTLVGPLTEPVLRELHFDVAFMGSMGISEDTGLTTSDPSEAFTKKRVLAQARQVVVLVDSSKEGKVAFAEAGSWDDVDVVITDQQISRAFARALAEHEIKVIKA